jgi:hypothetical protein
MICHEALLRKALFPGRKTGPKPNDLTFLASAFRKENQQGT